MTIVKTEDRLEVRDNPTIFWLFYSFFVLGGGVAVFLGLTSARSEWQFIIAVLIGVGNILGGGYMLKREPASIIRIDRRLKTVTITRWGILGRSRSSRPLTDVKEAKVEISEHTDGGSIFRPLLLFKDGSNLPISFFWHQSDVVSKDVVREVKSLITSG